MIFITIFMVFIVIIKIHFRLSLSSALIINISLADIKYISDHEDDIYNKNKSTSINKDSISNSIRGTLKISCQA